jgi:hypothetical protein
MHTRKRVFPVFLAAVLVAAACSEKQEVQIKQEQLAARSQELFDSVASGDQTPWKKYVADDAVYFDEKGHNMNKAQLVASITPLPEHYSGSIKMSNVQSRIVGNVAVLSYDLDEQESVFGQNLKARYHATDTWLRRKGQWQIVAGQIFRYYGDPAQGQADRARYADYTGTYELAPDTALKISLEGTQLYREREKQPKEELLPEAPDIFFRRGVEGRLLFHRDAAGKVDQLIDRRNDQDIVWKKSS